MAEVVLKAVHRDVIGKQVKALRREGKLPAVLYGRQMQPVPILLDHKETSRLLGSQSTTALVTIELDGKPYVTLIRDKQRDVLLGSLIHVDFQAVSMEEKLRVSVAVDIEGESLAVKDYNGILVLNTNELEVECLPMDLPERIVIDISSLKRIGDSIFVRDLRLPETVTVLADPNQAIAIVTTQAAEEVEAVEAVVAEVEEPEVIEHGKKEEEDF